MSCTQRAGDFLEFAGIFRNSAKTTKKMKINENNIVEQVMAETSQSAVQGSDQLLHLLQQQVMQLVPQQGAAQAAAVAGQQPAQGPLPIESP